MILHPAEFVVLQDPSVYITCPGPWVESHTVWVLIVISLICRIAIEDVARKTDRSLQSLFFIPMRIIALRRWLIRPKPTSLVTAGIFVSVCLFG